VGLSDYNIDGTRLFLFYDTKIDTVFCRDNNSVFVLFSLLKDCLRLQDTTLILVLFEVEPELRSR
jgi:hypothetical protein